MSWLRTHCTLSPPPNSAFTSMSHHSQQLYPDSTPIPRISLKATLPSPGLVQPISLTAGVEAHSSFCLGQRRSPRAGWLEVTFREHMGRWVVLNHLSSHHPEIMAGDDARLSLGILRNDGTNLCASWRPVLAVIFIIFWASWYLPHHKHSWYCLHEWECRKRRFVVPLLIVRTNWISQF